MRPILLVLCLMPVSLAGGRLEASGAVRFAELQVEARIRDRLASVTLTQTFRNDGERVLEGWYTFPLPEGASVGEFAMTMGGKLVKGAVVERKRAREIYEGIVRNKRDPGLLEQVDRSTFRMRVFPIEARGDVVVKLVYHQILDESGDTVEWRLPLARQRLDGSPIGLLRIDARVECEGHLRALGSTLGIITRMSETAMRLRHEAREVASAEDLVVNFARSKDPSGITVLSSMPPGEEGTFLALVSPPERTVDPIPKDVVFVLDTSGSMEGEKMAGAKRAFAHGIASLRPVDRFGVVTFSTEARALRGTLQPATGEAPAEALRYLRSLDATGGTALDDGLERAFRMLEPGRLGIVVLLTDGLPTVGERGAPAILAHLAERNRSRARVFVFGLGFDQDVALLDGIATATRGAREYVSPGQEMEFVLSRFFRRVVDPTLTDLALDLGPDAASVRPAKLPDLFAGDSLVVFGRYRAPGLRMITLRAGDAILAREALFSETDGTPALHGLWARAEVGFLLEQPRNVEIEREIVLLATRHGIVTPYTSGLVVEDGEMGVVEHEIDGDSVFEEAAGGGAAADAPLSGPGSNSAIGIGGGKRGRGGRRNAKAGGGSGMTDDTVELHLRSMADHPAMDGTHFLAPGTPLALLAFLGAGYTDRGSAPENKYAGNVRAGLRLLITSQQPSGQLRADLRDHAISALALAEGYWMTRNPRYRRPAEDACKWIAAQADLGDAVTACWIVNVFTTARLAGLVVDPGVLQRASALFDGVLQPSPTEMAAMLFARILLGEDPRTSKRLEPLTQGCLAALPTADPDLLFWGSMALFQVGGPPWRQWNEQMVPAIVHAKLPAEAPLETLAKHALTVEVYYRYDRVFGMRAR